MYGWTKCTIWAKITKMCPWMKNALGWGCPYGWIFGSGHPPPPSDLFLTDLQRGGVHQMTLCFCFYSFQGECRQAWGGGSSAFLVFRLKRLPRGSGIVPMSFRVEKFHDPGKAWISSFVLGGTSQKEGSGPYCCDAWASSSIRPACTLEAKYIRLFRLMP